MLNDIYVLEHHLLPFRWCFIQWCLFLQTSWNPTWSNNGKHLVFKMTRFVLLISLMPEDCCRGDATFLKGVAGIKLKSFSSFLVSGFSFPLHTASYYFRIRVVRSYTNTLVLCITLHCCLMFVSSWLVNPKQIQHQSPEALNCDIFCQSCENKGCINAQPQHWHHLVPNKVDDADRTCFDGDDWVDFFPSLFMFFGVCSFF